MASAKPVTRFVAPGPEVISSAKKPFLLAGQGIILSGAEQQLLEFAEKTGVPVACTLLGLGAFPANHPLYVGYLGMHGNYAPNVLTNDCDVLIAVGMRFDDRVTGDVNRYANNATVIHIDLDAAELNKNIPADYPVHADAREALAFLTKHVEPASHAQWLQQFRDLEQIEYQEVVSKRLAGESDELCMAEVIHAVSELNKQREDLIVVTDVGQHQMETARYFAYNQSRSNITSGGLGTMGFALPAAIGASIAQPEKTVVAVIGDGGFQMTIQELGTIMQYGLRVKILLLNNNFLGMVRQWQQLFFDRRYAFTEMHNPDFLTIAKGYHVAGMKVNERDVLNEQLNTWLNDPGSYLLECIVSREENVFPMVEMGASVSEIRLK